LVGGPKPLTSVFVAALGVAQDGGFPQIGCSLPCCQGNHSHKYPSSLAIVDVITSERWIIDATPNFGEQLRLLEQLQTVDSKFFASTALNNPTEAKAFLSGIFLTHASAAHTSGLLSLGREAANLKGIPVYALPRVAEFLKKNPPFNKLIEHGNIVLKDLKDQEKVALNWRISITAITVPNKDEFSETVGYLIEGPEKSLVYIPEVEDWSIDDPVVSLSPSSGSLLKSSTSQTPRAPASDKSEEGKKRYTLEELILMVDHALLDGTQFSAEELSSGVIPDPSQVPHPSVQQTVEFLRRLPDEDKRKVNFIHFNHTNPCIWDGANSAKNYVAEKGHLIVHQGQKYYV